jgi:hypothetical protein
MVFLRLSPRVRFMYTFISRHNYPLMGTDLVTVYSIEKQSGMDAPAGIWLVLLSL